MSYTVRRGDTLSAIGVRYGVSVQSVMRANGMRTSRIYTGQRLCIPRVVVQDDREDRDRRPHNFPVVPTFHPTFPTYNPCLYGPGVWVIAINGVPVNQGSFPGNCQPPNVVYTPPAYNAFPCTKGYFNPSNLCVQQPYPVKVGSTAYAVWNISDFSYGEFDMGDGRGYIGPISHEQQVGIPNVTGPRLIQLRWKDRAGNWQYDSMTIQVVP